MTSKAVEPRPSTVNKEDRKYFKYGAELTYWGLEWLGASVRYDHVVLNVDDNANQFRIFAPRILVRSHWLGEEVIFLQYSHYFYGDRMALQTWPGSARDAARRQRVQAIQAQMVF